MSARRMPALCVCLAAMIVLPSAAWAEPAPPKSITANQAVKTTATRPAQAVKAGQGRRALRTLGVIPPQTQPAEQPAERPAQRKPASFIFFSPYSYSFGSRRLPSQEREWSNYRYFDGRPGRFGYGFNDPTFSWGNEGDWYRHGFMRGYDLGTFDREGEERTEKLLAHARGQLQSGLQMFNKGDYLGAANAFKLAAETDQGDAAARIYAAHALLALGRYREAVSYLRRGFELQPNIALLNYDLRDDYGRREDFDKHLQQLQSALGLAPANIDRLIMLGYVYFFTNQREQAYAPLQRVLKLDQEDALARLLLDNGLLPDVAEDELRKSKRAR